MLSKRKLFSLILLLLAIAALYGMLANLRVQATHDYPLGSTETVSATHQPDVYELWQLTNEERAKVGVAPLALDDRLNGSAQAKADELARTNHFEHVAPDGKRGITYIPATEMGCVYVSENLAMNDPTPVDGWMSSPAHRAALLDGRYDSVGFGIAGVYVVQHFCDLP